LESAKQTRWWPEDKIEYLFSGVDIFVVSSKQESFGLTIIEAFAMAIPAVSTRCGGPEKVTKDGITGLFVPIQNPKSMAQAITQLLENPQTAHNIGQTGRKDVLSRFSVKCYAKGIEQIIEQSLK